MLAHVIDARGVVDKAVLKVVLIAHAVLGDVDLLVVGVIVLNAEQQIVQALGIDNPVPIGGGYAFAHACLTNTLEEPARGALIASAIVVDVVFALGGTQELTLVGIDAQAIVVGERGGQRGDVFVADVELAAGDMGQLGRSLHGIGCVMAAEGGVEHPAVVDDVGHTGGLAVGGAVGVEGVLGLQILDDADLALEAALVEGDDGLGVGHHHVVHELEGLVQAILLAVRPVSDDKAALGGRGNLIKGKPVLDLGELGKAELGVLYKGVDRRARQEALAAVQVEDLGRIKVIERDIGDNAGFIAGGKELVIEGNTLGVDLAGAVGEDTAPSDGDTDTVDAEALAQVDIDRVLVIEIACGVGGETALSSQEIVPGHFALAVRAGLALNLVSSGGAAKHKAVGELHGIGHESSFLWDTNRERCPNWGFGHQQREEISRGSRGAT